MSVIQTTILAIRQVLGERLYLVTLFIFAGLIFVMLIAIPLYTIPANTLALQLKIFRLKDYLLMAFVALLMGLNFSMQIYTWKKRKEQTKDMAQSAVAGTAVGISGIFAAMVGTATCASCLVFLFGLIGIGAGSVFFVLKHQTYFLLGAIALMIVSLYFVAKKINKTCISC